MGKSKKWYFSGKAITALVLFLIVIGVVIGVLVYRHKLYYHFAVVNPGKVYRSGTLSKRGLEAVYNLIHFKTIVNVRSVAENKLNKDGWYTREVNFCKKHGLKHINIPMVTSTPPRPLQLKEFFNIATNPKMQPVIIHCEMGVIRTGMMIAAYRIAIMHESNKYVFTHLQLFGHNLIKEGETEVEPFIMNFNYKKTMAEAGLQATGSRHQ